jgi:hypothetical protein
MLLSSLCSPIAGEQFVTGSTGKVHFCDLHVVSCEWNMWGIGDAANYEGLCPDKPLRRRCAPYRAQKPPKTQFLPSRGARLTLQRFWGQ